METDVKPRRAARHGRGSGLDEPRPRRTSLMILFVAFVALVTVVVWAGNYYSRCKATPEAASQGSRATVNFSVPDGAAAGDVVEDLADEGLIACGGFVGNLLMRGTGKTDQIRAGDYQLQRGMTLTEIMSLLTSPPKKILTTPVLVPPGYRLTEIATTLAEDLGISSKQFLTAAESGTYCWSRICPREARRSKGSSGPRPTGSRSRAPRPMTSSRRGCISSATRSTACHGSVQRSSASPRTRWSSSPP